MRRDGFVRIVAACMAMSGFGIVGCDSPLLAQVPPPPAAPRHSSATITPEGAAAGARAAAIPGPARIPLARVAAIAIPEGVEFVPRDAAMQLLAIRGGATPETVGILRPVSTAEAWHIVVQYRPEGHVVDDAATWDADRLMAEYRVVEQRDNPSKRANAGFETSLVGWIVPPTYDKSRRMLVTALAFDMVSRSGREALMNYRMYFFGRVGYLDFSVEAKPGQARELRERFVGIGQGVEFEPGQRYEDFVPGRDAKADRPIAPFL